MNQDSKGRNADNKRGPKPKKLVEKVVEGIQVGRDKTVVPPEEVMKLAAIGCKDNEIADWFGVSYSSLRYNFSEELLKGRTDMKMTLRRQMFTNAVTENNTTMQIWLSKNYLGMSDTPLDSEANQPLPWNENEASDTTTEVTDEYEEDIDGQEDQEHQDS